jgi:hypothetical protein
MPPQSSYSEHVSVILLAPIDPLAKDSTTMTRHRFHVDRSAQSSLQQSLCANDRRSLCLALALAAGLSAGCSKQAEPFERFTKERVDGAQNHGYVWFHHKPGHPLSGARYEAGVDIKAGFGLGVCRAVVGASVRPGKIFGQRCNIGSDGKEVINDDFDVLVAPRQSFWHMSSKEELDMSRALVGGKDSAGKPLYVCVARYVTGLSLFTKHHGYQPGQYANGKCTFAWEGNELPADEFFLLAVGKPDTAEKVSEAPRPATCLQGENACACLSLVGCAKPGLCPCASLVAPEERPMNSAALPAQEPPPSADAGSTDPDGNAPAAADAGAKAKHHARTD